nr:hypothetical protein [uncultured Dongia sp.]
MSTNGTSPDGLAQRCFLAILMISTGAGFLYVTFLACQFLFGVILSVVQLDPNGFSMLIYFVFVGVIALLLGNITLRILARLKRGS